MKEVVAVVPALETTLKELFGVDFVDPTEVKAIVEDVSNIATKIEKM